MRNISRTLKKKRDEEAKLREQKDVESTVAPAPTDPSYPEDPGDPGEVTDPYPKARIVRAKFNQSDFWEVEHGLGRLPVVEVWEGGFSVYRFGTQPFGTSYFGGGQIQSDMKLKTHEPEISKVDENIITIDWNGVAKSGEVVCISE